MQKSSLGVIGIMIIMMMLSGCASISVKKMSGNEAQIVPVGSTNAVYITADDLYCPKNKKTVAKCEVVDMRKFGSEQVNTLLTTFDTVLIERASISEDNGVVAVVGKSFLAVAMAPFSPGDSLKMAMNAGNGNYSINYSDLYFEVATNKGTKKYSCSDYRQDMRADTCRVEFQEKL